MPRRKPVRPSSDGFYRFKKRDSIAIKALKVAHNIRNLLNVEYKKLDSASTDRDWETLN